MSRLVSAALFVVSVGFFAAAFRELFGGTLADDFSQPDFARVWFGAVACLGAGLVVRVTS